MLIKDSYRAILEPIAINTMAQSLETITEPIAISLVSGRYLLYDINVVTYLRRAHSICGVLIGGIPQAPQQNVFQGLPLELLPEEVKLLIEKEAAYIVDDVAWHKERYSTLHGEDRKRYLGSLREEGLRMSQAQAAAARQKSAKALAKQAMLKASKSSGKSSRGDSSAPVVTETPNAQDSLFSVDRPASPAFSEASSKISSWEPAPLAMTPSTSYSPSSLPENPAPQPDPVVPASYALFRFLHNKKYFIMPGLRFGCNYNVYPGDPLRFHSHFLATSYEWNQEISMLDLVGGGRLGTGVKKGFLVGGADEDSDSGDVRAFTLEWAGM